mmetsp:Transcript_15906/g.67061  ORF Transcript_15906/g.67061 Transcript_15906/m.67061 type:complete len:394 (-) Transcript_15906:669-1850(-)
MPYPPVALAALLHDVFDFLHGGVHVAAADFADALLLAHAQNAPGELLDLANLRPALADDAAGLAGALHLHDGRGVGSVVGSSRRARVLRALADVAFAARVRGDGLGPEVVSDDAHEPPLELRLVERRRRGRRSGGVGHDRGGLAGEHHHLGRVHAEERCDRRDVRAGRHGADANARDRAIGTAALALAAAAAALLLGAFRRLARLARGGVLGSPRLALLLLGFLLLGSHHADAPRGAARSAALRRAPHRGVGLSCFFSRNCFSRRDATTVRCCQKNFQTQMNNLISRQSIPVDPLPRPLRRAPSRRREPPVLEVGFREQRRDVQARLFRVRRAVRRRVNELVDDFFQKLALFRCDPRDGAGRTLLHRAVQSVRHGGGIVGRHIVFVVLVRSRF